MFYDTSKYDRHVQFQTPTDTITSGSVSRSWANTFTAYAGLVREPSDTSEQSGKRTTEGKATWVFQYNEAIVSDGRFYEDGDSTLYYYVTGITTNRRRSEMTITAEVRR